MKIYRLALIGFGNVGQGLAHILLERSDWLADRFGIGFQIVAVSDLQRGSCYNPDGLSTSGLLATIRENGSLTTVTAQHYDWDSLRTINESNADIVIEISYTDLRTGEPALTHVQAALRAGKHVVTTNKGPTALHFPELLALAHKNGLELGVEGTVMSGTPALRMAMETLAGANVKRIQGILNGTTNYILTKMENGSDYTEALAEAQQKGYAEADPTGDVDGHDAAGKVVILANLLMDLPITMKDVSCEGITHLTADDIMGAVASGERWKLIGTVEKTRASFSAGVQAQRVPLDHPLASISGATNAITYTTDLLGDITIVGPGAGRVETGYAILEDMLAIHRNRST